MPLERALERSDQWMRECASLVNGASFDTTNRLRVAVSLLHLCIEHQTGIHSLVNLGVIGSAFALLRPQLEAYVRGIWYHRCATDQQVTAFLGGAEPPKIGALIGALQTLDGFDAVLLNDLKKKVWRNLNDFTHGGTIQVKARISMNEIASNYKYEHIAGLLASAATFSLLAGVGLAAAIGSESLAQGLYAAYHRIYETAV